VREIIQQRMMMFRKKRTLKIEGGGESVVEGLEMNKRTVPFSRNTSGFSPNRRRKTVFNPSFALTVMV